ncbi:MAG: BlaI/MecI/CopY family transcriptional regulator [Planctomycetaceae bacterium]|nr:BlaI/MecI/CopY family transcriptional regulator [Planctomycetaceae bacterium]
MRLTEAEWQIMNALWEKWPATARQVADRLPKDVNWAYTTIKTMLTRLSDKKAVQESKKGHVGLYEPLLSKQTAQRSALKTLVNQAFDGAFGPLMHFLVEEQTLTDKQKLELVEALNKDEQKDGGKEQVQ